MAGAVFGPIKMQEIWVKTAEATMRIDDDEEASEKVQQEELKFLESQKVKLEERPESAARIPLLKEIQAVIETTRQKLKESRPIERQLTIAQARLEKAEDS